ncbi:Novel protein [Strongyloides ratti]|uniref:Novel protein n=1 Tax=Strongyloides ratti TaxID=34506 RepID=A0A090MZD5_STRRB|nr:Novel protein [Strongyloides ratti]CEF68744.1 Novel protein [Strongyloides ratti]
MASKVSLKLGNIFSVVYVTVPKMENAKVIARNVVKEKLAACVNIIPGITSIYSWNGTIEEDQECLLVIKTKKNLINELKNEILKNHPYEVPEFIALPIEEGSDPYLKWIESQVKTI